MQLLLICVSCPALFFVYSRGSQKIGMQSLANPVANIMTTAAPVQKKF